ncbi:MAG: hypothetical protein CMB99_06170 [Flavobacteriaceae bacterium]|nr:hypothetical protein [Flavobacteriaceae bacterium]|tara:strand:- start:1926 stop:2201 length:276 start_codon:yes stop_codon:yes gene_type:complete
MDIVLQYYGFSDFFPDKSNTFSTNEICYLALNAEHFLIFEKTESSSYNLYVSQFNNEKEIGTKSPSILELLVESYDKSLPEHRLALRAYLE